MSVQKAGRGYNGNEKVDEKMAIDGESVAISVKRAWNMSGKVRFVRKVRFGALYASYASTLKSAQRSLISFIKFASN